MKSRTAHFYFIFSPCWPSINVIQSCGNLGWQIPPCKSGGGTRVPLPPFLTMTRVYFFLQPPSFHDTHMRVEIFFFFFSSLFLPPRFYFLFYFSGHPLVVVEKYTGRSHEKRKRKFVTSLEDSHLPNCVPNIYLVQNLFRLHAWYMGYCIILVHVSACILNQD